MPDEEISRREQNESARHKRATTGSLLRRLTEVFAASNLIRASRGWEGTSGKKEGRNYNRPLAERSLFNLGARIRAAETAERKPQNHSK